MPLRGDRTVDGVLKLVQRDGIPRIGDFYFDGDGARTVAAGDGKPEKRRHVIIMAEKGRINFATPGAEEGLRSVSTSCERLAANEPTLAALVKRLDDALADMGTAGEIVPSELAYVLDEDVDSVEAVLAELVDLGGLKREERIHLSQRLHGVDHRGVSGCGRPRCNPGVRRVQAALGRH